MKAIQVKFLPATDHKGTRLKVWAEGIKAKIISRDYALDFKDQAFIVAREYIQSLNWGDIYGFGMLPNGDYCATLDHERV